MTVHSAMEEGRRIGRDIKFDCLRVVKWRRSRDVEERIEKRVIRDRLLTGSRREVGMSRALPLWRRGKLLEAAEKMGVNRATVLSLRRHHIKQNNMYMSEDLLKLGTMDEKLAAANAFENCVGRYLDDLGVDYVGEDEQRLRNPPKIGHYHPGTPDFRFDVPFVIDDCEGRKWEINWVEVKHFYGASTITWNNKSACGKIPKKATTYRENFGPGAYLFAYGVGEG
ncbi:hypothetical protein TrRE_jg3628, partial [Triparma retinervis]